MRNKVDFGHVGYVVQINVRLLTVLLDHGYLPVVSSLGADAGFAVDLERPVLSRLIEALESRQMPLHATLEEYLLEAGWGNLTELGVALARLEALRKTEAPP